MLIYFYLMCLLSLMIPDKIKRTISSQYFYTRLIPIVFFNTLISMIISFSLLTINNQQGNAYAFSIITFVAHYFLLNLLVGLLASCFSVVLNKKASTIIMIFFFSLLQVILLFDTRIYTMFHYHINPLVLNVITTEGVSDSVIIGKGTIAVFSLILIGILCAEIIVHSYFSNINKNPEKKSLLRAKNISKVIFWTGLLLVVTDKFIYAYGDIVNNTAITQNIKLFPLYQPLTVKRFASKILHIKVDRELNFKVSTKDTTLNYPQKPLKFNPSAGKKFNIIIIVVDGLRSDMLDKDIMPNTWEFGRRNIIFKNHYSGGNGTRFGIFSLLYGIDGTYWHNFLARRVSPVLIDTLIDNGYEFKILSSTHLTFPEFRKTAFIRIPDSIEDSFVNTDTAERDRIITEKFINYIANSDGKKPFFSFIFYDSSHQPYHYSKGFEKFRPVSDHEINYFKDISKDNISILKNRYKNSIFYNDYLIGNIISSLKKNNLFDNSMVVVTGDHGEEFYENGYFGHTSSFDDYQVKTAFVLHYPGLEPFSTERITSHLDLVPTLIESLGCISPPEDYSHGFSLLNKTLHTHITSSNWDSSAIIDDEYKIIFSTEMYNLRSFEVRRKNDYSLIGNQKDVIKQKSKILLDTALRMSEFYR